CEAARVWHYYFIQLLRSLYFNTVKDVKWVLYSTCLKDWYEKYLKKVVNLTLDAKHQGEEMKC
ncbi:MAG: hypothetical protein V7K32_19870, partial [Nostoc sp.]